MGDVVDAIDMSMGAWFEADIVKITEKEGEEGENAQNVVSNNNNNEEISTKADAKPLDQNDDTISKDTSEKVIPNGDVETPMDTECNEPSEQRTCSSDESISKAGGSSSGTSAGEHDSHWTRHDGLVYHVKYEG